jgi:hypothetical protein
MNDKKEGLKETPNCCGPMPYGLESRGSWVINRVLLHEMIGLYSREGCQLLAINLILSIPTINRVLRNLRTNGSIPMPDLAHEDEISFVIPSGQ